MNVGNQTVDGPHWLSIVGKKMSSTQVHQQFGYWHSSKYRLYWAEKRNAYRLEGELIMTDFSFRSEPLTEFFFRIFRIFLGIKVNNCLWNNQEPW